MNSKLLFKAAMAAYKPNPKLKARQQKDLELWKEWKDSGEHPEKLDPLFKQFRGVLNNRIRLYQGKVPVPPAVVEAEVNKQFLTALRKYDPSKVGKTTGKPAALGTFVHGQVRKSGRFIKKYQNVGYMPEKRIDKITEFNTARAEMKDELLRDPTAMELSTRLNWPIAEVNRMEAEQRQDYIASGFEAEGMSDPTFFMPSRDREVLSLIKYELDDRENYVLEHSLGLNGKPKKGTGEIAKDLGVSAPTVSRIKARVYDKIKLYRDAF